MLFTSSLKEQALFEKEEKRARSFHLV